MVSFFSAGTGNRKRVSRNMRTSLIGVNYCYLPPLQERRAVSRRRVKNIPASYDEPMIRVTRRRQVHDSVIL